MQRRSSTLLLVALSLASGAAWAAAFAREPLSIASWGLLAPLVVLLAGRRPALAGYLHGVAFWLVGISWLPRVVHVFGDLPWWLSIVAFVGLALFLALYGALFGWLGGRILRGGSGPLGLASVEPEAMPAAAGPSWRGAPAAAWLPALLALPSLWVLLEWVRGWLFSGFPWNLAGYAWIGVPGALPLASWIGVWGLSWLVVFSGAGLGVSWLTRRTTPGTVAVLLPLLLLAVAGRYAGDGTAPVRLGSGEAVERPGPPLPVVLLQPNIANELDPESETILANYELVFELSRDLCTPGTLLVWPESATWPYGYSRGVRLKADLAALTAAGGCTVLLNSAHREGETWYNSAFLAGPEGEIGRYDKRHLVPFGEYVPLAGVFRFLDSLARHAGDFTPGDELRLLPWRGEELGLSICFEVTFPSEVADTVRAGATMLVTVTNDAWYGDTWAPWQHFRAARMRAAESRRPLLRAAITGISALVAPDGSVVSSLGPFEQGAVAGRVRGRRELSPASRWPWAAVAASGVIALAVLLPWPRREPAG